MQDKAIPKASLLKLLVLLIVVASIIYIQNNYLNLTPEELQSWVLSFGWYAYLVFFLFAFVRPLILFPITIYYLAGGLAFGAISGGLLSVAGAIISASLAHQIAFHSEGKFIPEVWRQKIVAIKTRIGNHSFRNMLMIRLIPGISFDLLSYAAGTARLGWRPFIIATLIGTSPRIIAYSYVGAKALDTGSKEFWIAIITLTVVIVTPLLIYRYVNANSKK